MNFNLIELNHLIEKWGTDLNTDGFMDFIEKINQFTSSMFSVSLPPPNSMVDAFSYIT